jgi:hypothetical protein
VKLVRIYWNCAAALGTAVIIIYAGQSIIDVANWLVATLENLGRSF